MKNKNSLSLPKSSFKEKKRKAYVSARLVRHGDLRELTAQNVGISVDSSLSFAAS